MLLAEYDHMIETLPPNRSDQPLGVRILPRAGRTREDLTDPHAGDSASERVTIDPVAISQQPARGGVVRKRFNDLLGRPRRRRMLGDVDVNDPPAVMHQHDEDEQDSAREGRYGEEIDRDRSRSAC